MANRTREFFIQVTWGISSCLAALAAGGAFAQDKPLGASTTTGSLTYAGKTHIVQAAAPTTEATRSIMKLRLPDGSVVLSDRVPPGAKILEQIAVAAAPDSILVAQRERDYWSARDRELNQRLVAERERDAQRQRAAASQAEALQERELGREVYIIHGVRRGRVNNSLVPTGYSAYTSSPGVRNGIASNGGTR